MDLSPDEENFQGRLLHQAALWDNLELLQELLASGADPDARDQHGRSALHAAALAERSRCLGALCDAGAQPDARSDTHTGGKTALHIAAERGHVDNIRTLVSAGATVAPPDATGASPRALAVRASHRHAANALRDAEDALERERLSQHAVLRDLVTRADAAQLKSRLAALGSTAGLIVNMTPGGANTLLYVACESGHVGIVSSLIAGGADGRAHPVTRYGPLHAAARHNHAAVAKLLLAHYPQAVQQETVEKWLPLHAACVGGHAALVTLLLEYPYPEAVLTTYTDARGEWQYTAAFDVNARDVTGQTCLYVACAQGNLPCVNALLDHMVPCEPTDDTQCVEPSPRAAAALSPLRSGISLGIHAIVSKLTGNTRSLSSSTVRKLAPVRPELARGCDSCVAAAARGNHLAVLQRLLQAGAEASAPAQPPDDKSSPSMCVGRDLRRRSRSASAAPLAPLRPCATPSPTRTSHNTDRDGPWSALAISCRLRHVSCASALLSRGATDATCRALRECLDNDLADLAAKILATKAYPDPDYKLNKSTVSESVLTSRQSDSTLTYSAVCPTIPVMINWRDLKCHISHLRMQWIRLGALHVNSKLGSGAGALLAVTRVDVASNELRLLPPDLFRMPSLRYLNAAQNKLSRLPSSEDPLEEEEGGGGWRGRSRRGKKVAVYTAPQLLEVYLQDNRLEELPPGLFSLPALTTLDVSNNKLRALPDAMWSAPALRDLNAAFNHLRDLPTGETENASEGVSPLASSPVEQRSASVAVLLPNTSLSKSSSRSPSIENSESDLLDDGEPIPVVANRGGNAVVSTASRVHAWRGPVECPPPAARGPSALAALNLAHNQFPCIPSALACRAASLQRLNMSYNSLRSMSYVTSYPSSLRQLDLSHNEITCWPSLPQLENFGTESPLACYCPNRGATRPRSGGGVRSQLMSAACPARRHLRLEGTRTLILSNNLLTRIQLTTDDDGYASDAVDDNDDDDEWGGGGGGELKTRLLFPLLSMLDVSCNLLKSIPPALRRMTNLAVLNISNNKDISTLPPQMGLLTRLWSLNASGCALSEPLRGMVGGAAGAGGRYKSADVIGYLKSVLHCATKYSRMRLMLVGHQGIGKTSLLECLRQESAIQHRRKPTDHWAARMGNKSSRKNMSTVGVDIGTWTYEKQRSTRGPVTFRTWDFGGQQEYYATHQYFLSRRCLYLVLWKVTDGRKGLLAALTWLRSIQARAPGAPVIMVGTHYDQVSTSLLHDSETPEALQRLIRSSVMGAPDADKLGLPRVMDSLEVSCSTRHNIRLLADIIYSVAYSVKPPGSKEPLLEQRIPATYLALEECVTSLAADLTEPVLNHNDYKRLVTQYMQQKNHKMFRDATELHQATMFLHENGVLLHYDDATLKELYFLRPQWLCDVLAHVVTVREINPFATNGIMKVEDLAHVFKASPTLTRADEASSLGVSLLHKFELALCWDARTLIIPPLLPAEEPAAPQLPVRGRSWSSVSRTSGRRPWSALNPHLGPLPDSSRHTDSPALIQESTPPTEGISLSGRAGTPLTRLLLVTYVPCGFWARLCCRMLADAALAKATTQLYRANEMESDESISRALEMEWGWSVWRQGLRLACGGLTLVCVREVPPSHEPLLPAPHDAGPPHPYENVKLRVKQDGAWCELDIQSSACIEIQLPAQSCVVRRDDAMPIAGYQSISLEPNPSTLAKVLAIVSDHVDLLLEDWYPSLGTRFVHTSEGRCLITRVVPCPACLKDLMPRSRDPDVLAQQAFRRLELGVEPAPVRARVSQDSRASDGDSGVGAESNASSRIGSVEGVGVGVGGAVPPLGACWAWAWGWTVEQCIHSACAQLPLHCALHPDVALHHVAPDTLLLDIPEEFRARWEHITRRAVAGRGAFGTVLSAHWRVPGRPEVDVALKALQPVAPPAGSEPQSMHAYKAALSRWEREPAAAACRAYCGLRQELTILSQLRHPHAVPLRAVCAAPLALLLALAPQGGLDGIIREYCGCGSRLGVRAGRATLLQVARALEYLHDRRIVYRDLKSENVLVWRMPKVEEAAAAERNPSPIDVHVKLGDYGISRLAPPSGTKGFGGTEGFMAPEIMRYNGEEEYNEKVDCFSFGMLMYEVITGRQPFEGHEAVKEAILEGGRPSLSPREIEYPCCMLETMRRCWGCSPLARPSAGALVSLFRAPEGSALRDAARVAPLAPLAPLAPSGRHAYAAVRVQLPDADAPGWELWYGGGEAERAHSLLVPTVHFTHHHTIRIPPDKDVPVVVTAMCRVGGSVWMGDSVGRLSVFSAGTCELVWSVRVQDAVGGARAPIAALQPLTQLHRVALALACGRLFLVSSSRPEEEGSFVLTELGTATELVCLAARNEQDQATVWAGGAGLSAYSVNAAGVSSAEQLSQDAVTLLAADDHTPAVFVCTEPGVCVYQWTDGQQTARLDCSKLAPSSESLQTIDEGLTEHKCKVTALCCASGVVVAGTAWGCVVLAAAATLRPLAVCRPYEAQVSGIVPLVGKAGAEGEDMVATFGTGYRPLLQRYAPVPLSNPNQYQTGLYCLLWKTQHFLPD